MRYGLLYKKNRGFSLIELSIVVVIIALLATSVMGGTKLVKSAKISAVVKEIGEIKTVIDAFEIKYAALPGDFSGASSLWSDCAGDDGDGNLQLSSSEDHGFGHLYYADLLPRLPVDSNTSATTSCTNGQYYSSAVMRMAYHLGGLVEVASNNSMAHSAFADTVNDTYPNVTRYLKRSFIVTDGIGSDSVIDFSSSAISTENAYHIDSKMDNGIPNSGQVASEGSASGCASGSTYSLTTEGKICTMFFRFR